MTSTIETKKHYPGCYRVSAGTDLFAQITKVGREWHAEYRDTQTGDFRRHAGVWSTLADAVDEVTTAVQRGFF